MKILVVGSINMDMVTYASRIPKQGETAFGRGFIKNPGGKGANQACAAARLGADIAFLGAVGVDAFGKELEDCLRENGVKPILKRVKEPTGCATILIEEENHDNRIIVIQGANGQIWEEDIDKNLALIKEADIIMTQLEIPLETVGYLAEIVHRYHKIFLLNPAPGIQLPEEILAHVTYLTPNETELSLVSGIEIQDEASFFLACETLLGKGVETLLITLGSKGVYLYSNERKELIPAYKVEAVDTTAAGDCFNGAFAAFLAKGMDIRRAISYAEKASSLCVKRRGAICSLPKLDEIKIDE